jgi:hypothetical protein
MKRDAGYQRREYSGDRNSLRQGKTVNPQDIIRKSARERGVQSK